MASKISSGNVVEDAEKIIGFGSEDEWFDYRLEHDPVFLQRVKHARQSLRAGRDVKLEDVKA